jgi:predicted SAM-dependent methyltransferase
MKLDLACGNNKMEGFTGVDCVKLEKVDIICNLQEYPWPFEDGSVEEIFCSHYVEHIPHGDGKDGLFRFFDECCRILKPGGTIKVIAPYYSSIRAWQDPTHRRAISEATFFYMNKGWREQNKLEYYQVDCDFDFTYGYIFSQAWQTRSKEAQLFAAAHYINVIEDIHVVFTKR